MPLIGPDERNIALTDIDCIIRLHPDFSLPDSFRKRPEFMFPNASEDKFYGKLLELKDQFPEELESVVEYEWARRVSLPQS
ncbi:FRG domain protein (fragment) [Cupriavidus taiwanensis]